MTSSPAISVIIPTINEEDRLSLVLSDLGASRVSYEIIVADGGSTDRTKEIAREGGALVIDCQKGRGHQLKAGADHAKGEALFFLHADSRLAASTLEAIQNCLEDDTVIGGNFAVRYDGKKVFDRFTERLCGIIRHAGVYYGDSGIFVRREDYERIGGFRRLEIMEDFDFVTRLERIGRTKQICQPSLLSSSRRFRRRSALGNIALWVKMHTWYALGVPADELARRYNS